jgi:DNA-binding transcriptional LysR family regulator
MQEADPFADVSLFVATARAGSFTRAADRLGITKSAVGKAITRLEARLGFQLFHRTTRLTRLTADGEAYLAACTRALEEIHAAQFALSSGNRVLSGRVHIDMPVAFGRRVLLPLLMDSVRPHPELSLTLSFSEATSDLLQDDVDIAIRFGTVKDSTLLVARRLTTQQRVICAAPAYLRSFREPKTLADIASHRCIVGTLKGPPTVWSVQSPEGHTSVTPPATHQLSDGEAMVDAAIAGLGLVQLPSALVRGAIQQGLLTAVLGNFASSVEVQAVWKRQAHLSPRVRYMVDQMVACAEAGKLD